jgi:radical SAM protein with 4Fe4S-binding SPASM domain
LDLVSQLADAGIREITLIGGEAYLRPDWLRIASAIRAAGMSCSVTTGGFGISAAAARQIRDAGIQQVSISVDGRAAAHDLQRGRAGSWSACFRSFEYLRSAGVPMTCNTQINRLSAPDLPLIYSDILAAGCHAWQWQLTVPMGRAADHPEILMQPAELLELYPVLARIAENAKRDDVYIFADNNIGYYGPYERLLRGHAQPGAIWTGCQAGLSGLGIEADGTIKGCPSLPTAAYRGGNIREERLAAILAQAPELAINREGTAPLWGFCKTCDYAELCRAGCNWTAHVFFGKRGNNPYCHHRALTLARRGIRERLEQVEAAPGEPFDHGRFSLIEEPLLREWPADDPLRFTADRVQWQERTPSSGAFFPILA